MLISNESTRLQVVKSIVAVSVSSSFDSSRIQVMLIRTTNLLAAFHALFDDAAVTLSISNGGSILEVSIICAFSFNILLILSISTTFAPARLDLLSNALCVSFTNLLIQLITGD